MLLFLAVCARGLDGFNYTQVFELLQPHWYPLGMAPDANNARYQVLVHIQENLMDMVDDGKIAGEELVELNNSMGEIAAAVLDCLSFEIETLDESKTAIAKIKLKDLLD